MSKLPSELDVLVIGAGPAGTAAAAIVRRAGHSVRIVEAKRFPRFVIGESLLPHCMDILHEADLLDAVRARGYQVKNGALFLRGDQRCDFQFSEQHTRGWTWTWQVPRADFDDTLAQRVVEMGVPIHWRHEVIDASFRDGPSLVIRDAEEHCVTVRPRFVIDASGYGRVLPRLLDLELPSVLPPRTALFTHVRGDHRPPGLEEGRIWICLHPQGAWLWVIPFSNGVTSVGAVASPEFFEKYPANPTERLREIIAGDRAAGQRLRDAAFLWEPQKLSGYSAAVKRLHGPGYCLVGNATEFLDPVFSSGVTLALDSGARAAKLVVRQLAGETPDWNVEYTKPMQMGVDVFRTFVTRWYDGALPELFFSAQQDSAARAQICSVLAGYVWDESNPFVREHARKVDQLARIARFSRAVHTAPPARP